MVQLVAIWASKICNVRTYLRGGVEYAGEERPLSCWRRGGRDRQRQSQSEPPRQQRQRHGIARYGSTRVLSGRTGTHVRTYIFLCTRTLASPYSLRVGKIRSEHSSTWIRLEQLQQGDPNRLRWGRRGQKWRPNAPTRTHFRPKIALGMLRHGHGARLLGVRHGPIWRPPNYRPPSNL